MPLSRVKMKVYTRTSTPFIVALVIIWLFVIFMPAPYARYFLAFTATLFVLFAAALYFAGDWVLDDRYLPHVRDPWTTQALLMDASDQALPALPTLSKNSLMYVALILEEAAELMKDGVVPALRQELDEPTIAIRDNSSPDEAARRVLNVVHNKLRGEASAMAVTSQKVRTLLREVPDFAVTLQGMYAIGAFDGTTDLTVVNCGFALASGLPGAEGYAEVARSNASKANPDTGKIDKTPDGKWVKGRDFYKPNLEEVLRLHVSRTS